jgi:hypothetical protein
MSYRLKGVASFVPHCVEKSKSSSYRGIIVPAGCTAVGLWGSLAILGHDKALTLRRSVPRVSTSSLPAKRKRLDVLATALRQGGSSHVAIGEDVPTIMQHHGPQLE